MIINKDCYYAILEDFKDYKGKIDLIYIDPPFGKGYDFKTKNNKFQDRNYPLSEYKGEIDVLLNSFDLNDNKINYLKFMYPRLKLMNEYLSDTGSFYLHCDPTASHYLKVIMDGIFGSNNFINEIVWHYQTGGASKKHFSKKHDVILMYSKTDKYNFYPNEIMTLRTEKSLKSSRIAQGDDKKYPMDVWTDIQALNAMAKERLGYPTQKPERLLERIIKASSNEGDIVADFFCGCGTTIYASQKLGRKWLGCDINKDAVNLTNNRLLNK
jgi:adenine specific DNA methylase Mod